MSSFLSIPSIRGETALSEMASSIITIIRSEVVHAGTGSNIHINAAQKNIAMTRCCMTVSPSMPNTVEGKRAIIKAINEIVVTFI